jgi:quinoprotein glucose dehydrogenase
VYPELEAKGIKNTGTPNLGGPITTAGGLVFIASTNDARIRAFDSKTGKELWWGQLDATGNATPMTYLGKNGKQYIVIEAGAPGHLRAFPGYNPDGADTVTAFALP